MSIRPINSIYLVPKYNSKKEEVGFNVLTENNGVVSTLKENELGINEANVRLIRYLRNNGIDITA